MLTPGARSVGVTVCRTVIELVGPDSKEESVAMRQKKSWTAAMLDDLVAAGMYVGPDRVERAEQRHSADWGVRSIRSHSGLRERKSGGLFHRAATSRARTSGTGR